MHSSERQIIGRYAAFRLHATHDPKATTAKARQTFLDRFLSDVPLDLPHEERLRRAASARKAHFTLLALRSAQARRRRSKVKSLGVYADLPEPKDAPQVQGEA